MGLNKKAIAVITTMLILIIISTLILLASNRNKNKVIDNETIGEVTKEKELIQEEKMDTKKKIEVTEIPNNNQPIINSSNFDLSNIDIVDPNSTKETASLFAYLKNISQHYILFGHQHATTQGLTINKTDGTESDVYNAVGAFPAVYGWDTLSLTGEEGTKEQLKQVMEKAYERGGIITLSAHMPNFVTGGDFYDTSKAVNNILPNGSHNKQYTEYLDMIADYALDLKGKDGELIPIIFRPFHENSGNWFWWGTASCTTEEYVKVFRYTVEYLRDYRGVHNFLYAYSPNGHFADEDEYLERYPGDDYIDIIGFDVYHNDPKNNTDWMDLVVKDARIVVSIAKSRNKVAAITETGIGNGLLLEGNPIKKWYTKLLNKLLADDVAKQVAYIMVWRNGEDTHFWVPFREHTVHGNHEMLDNFIEFYNHEVTVFNDRLQGVYDLIVKTQQKEPYMYIMYPLKREEIKDKYLIKTKVLNAGIDDVSKVTIKIGKDKIDANLIGEYYIAEWDATNESKGSLVELKVEAIYKSGDKQEDAVLVKIYDEKQETLSSPDVIDDFEDLYGDNEDLQSIYKKNPDGNKVLIKHNDKSKNSGKFSMQYEYTLGIPNYAGVSKTMHDTNWNNYNGIEFWLKPDGKGQVLTIQFKSKDIYWETYYQLTGTEPTLVKIPFSEFKLPPWYSGLAEMDRSSVTEFSLYVNAAAGTPDIKSVLYFDDIKLTK